MLLVGFHIDEWKKFQVWKLVLLIFDAVLAWNKWKVDLAGVENLTKWEATTKFTCQLKFALFIGYYFLRKLQTNFMLSLHQYLWDIQSSLFGDAINLCLFIVSILLNNRTLWLRFNIQYFLFFDCFLIYFCNLIFFLQLYLYKLILFLQLYFYNLLYLYKLILFVLLYFYLLIDWYIHFDVC